MRGRLRHKDGVGLYAKVAWFDLGSPLFSNYFLYLASSEPYWQKVTLSSIAYQSLFASYAPKGFRAAFAIEEDLNDFLGLWIKLGSTILTNPKNGATPQDAEERDDLIARLRLDFKTELMMKW